MNRSHFNRVVVDLSQAIEDMIGRKLSDEGLQFNRLMFRSEARIDLQKVVKDALFHGASVVPEGVASDA